MPNNMPRSVLEFSGIAWVSRGHPDNGPAPPYPMSALPLKADMLSVGADVR